MYIKRNTDLKNKELIKLGFSATVVLVCIFELIDLDFLLNMFNSYLGKVKKL